MVNISTVRGGPGAGPRNIDLRLSMREALLVHQALRDKEAELRKEAWWLGQRGNPEKAADLNRQAQENADAAERVFRILDGMMDIRR